MVSCRWVTTAVDSRDCATGLKVDGGMATRTVFCSFHYDRDVLRVQLVRNIGAVDGSPTFGSQEGETVRRSSRQAVVNWIDKQMAYKRAVVVLIGQETANRPWVKYEIEKAWNSKKPLVGVHISGCRLWGSATTKGLIPSTPPTSRVCLSSTPPSGTISAGSTPRPHTPTLLPTCPAG